MRDLLDVPRRRLKRMTMPGEEFARAARVAFAGRTVRLYGGRRVAILVIGRKR